MIILRQKEFNSKESKRINNKYFEEIGEKVGNFNLNPGESAKVSGRMFLNDHSYRNPNVDELVRRQEGKEMMQGLKKLDPRIDVNKAYQRTLKKQLMEKHGNPKTAGKLVKEIVNKLK